MNKNAKQTSLSAKLSQLSKKLKVPYRHVLTEFLLERLAVRICNNSNFSELFVFKGGFVSVKVYDSPRYTVDLDAHFKKNTFKKLLPELIRLIESDIDDGTWFHFEKSIDLETQSEYGGTRLIFRAGLGEKLKDVKRAQIINLDIGHGDPITPAPRDINTECIVGGGSFSWKVYPLETTVAEKLHALLTRRSENSRSKDIFDLSIFLPKCERKTLKIAIGRTFEYRGNPVPGSISESLRDIDLSLMRRGWAAAVEDMDGAPTIDEAYASIVKFFKG